MSVSLSHGECVPAAHGTPQVRGLGGYSERICYADVNNHTSDAPEARNE
jgi:hypothetical protein